MVLKSLLCSHIDVVTGEVEDSGDGDISLLQVEDMGAAWGPLWDVNCSTQAAVAFSGISHNGPGSQQHQLHQRLEEPFDLNVWRGLSLVMYLYVTGPQDQY